MRQVHNSESPAGIEDSRIRKGLRKLENFWLCASCSSSLVVRNIRGKVEVVPRESSVSDGGNTLGTATLTSGQASFSTRLLQSGLRNLAATYSGDSTHAGSISAVKYQAVNASPANGFATAATYSTGAAPVSIAAGDFNLDGKTDLVTANSTANTISVLLGNGDGTFGANTDYAVGNQPVAVVVADFNNDGKPDIAVANQNSNTVSILLGNGNGTFQPPFSVAAGNTPDSL